METNRSNLTVQLSILLTALGFCAATLGTPAQARADQKTGAEKEAGMDFGVGVRIGGLGFRHTKNESVSWQDCRMNGSGLYATLDITDHFFAELSTEFYHATGQTAASGMDRVSVYVLGAAGARVLPDSLVSPYVQIGVGPEWTRIDVGDHQHTTVLAAPFAGVGGELNLGSLKLGTHLRTYLMGIPEHAHGGGDSSDSLSVYYEQASQMQFFVRWVF